MYEAIRINSRTKKITQIKPLNRRTPGSTLDGNPPEHCIDIQCHMYDIRTTMSSTYRGTTHAKSRVALNFDGA